MEERIAGSQHADASAGKRQHVAHLGIERGRPGAGLAFAERCDERKVARAAEDEFGLGDQPLGLVAETRYTVLADADDC